MWMLRKFAEGYNDMYFADDAMQNVKAVRDVLQQVDARSKIVQAKALNNVKNVERLDSPDVYGDKSQPNVQINLQSEHLRALKDINASEDGLLTDRSDSRE